MANEETAAPLICGAEKTFAGAREGEPWRLKCERQPGHVGAHEGHGQSWYRSPHPGEIDWARRRYQTSREVSAGIFEQRRQAKKPLGVSVDPGSTAEVLLAGLVACGRALGRIEHEIEQRKHWQKVIAAASRSFSAGPESVPTEHEWAQAGQFVFAAVQQYADEPQSEPTEPIRERAEALAILILQGRRLGTPPNFLIRAGAALEVLRAAWRKAQRGGT